MQHHGAGPPGACSLSGRVPAPAQERTHTHKANFAHMGCVPNAPRRGGLLLPAWPLRAECATLLSECREVPGPRCAHRKPPRSQPSTLSVPRVRVRPQPRDRPGCGAWVWRACRPQSTRPDFTLKNREPQHPTWPQEGPGHVGPLEQTQVFASQTTEVPRRLHVPTALPQWPPRAPRVW